MNSDESDRGEKLASGTKPDLKFVKDKNQFKPVSVVGASDTEHEALWTEGQTGDVSWVKAECQTGAPTDYSIGGVLGDFTVMKIQPKQVTLDHHGNPPVVLHLPEPVLLN